jgi:hypothetical protein
MRADRKNAETTIARESVTPTQAKTTDNPAMAIIQRRVVNRGLRAGKFDTFLINTLVILSGGRHYRHGDGRLTRPVG